MNEMFLQVFFFKFSVQNSDNKGDIFLKPQENSIFVALDSKLFLLVLSQMNLKKYFVELL